jgi:hypothetical protein
MGLAAFFLLAGLTADLPLAFAFTGFLVIGLSLDGERLAQIRMLYKATAATRPQAPTNWSFR